MRGGKTASDAPLLEPERPVVEGPPRGAAPLDPTDIRIEAKPLPLEQIVARLAKDGIDLYPEFQPRAGLWNPIEQSRLIESLLIRVPIPAFYFDAGDERRWLVIDGLQRLTALKLFAVERKLKLKGLEYLADLNGKAFDDLPRHHQRRILETPVTAFLLREGCPPAVKLNIYRRINTGGQTLDPRQIRHALNQGPATRFLKLLAGSKDFKAAVGDLGSGLEAQDCVLRVLAFRLTPPADYPGGDPEAFLAGQMARLGAADGKALRALKADFQRALSAARALFGPWAFRRPGAVPGPVNRALLAAWAVALAGLNEQELEALQQQKEPLNQGFIKLMSNNPAFVEALSSATGDPSKIKLRFSAIETLIRETLACSPT